MKNRIYIALYIAATFACAVAFRANADELVVNSNGSQSLTEGLAMHVETDGMTGEVLLLNAETPSLSGNPGDAPTVTGAWHVTTVNAKGRRQEWIAQCYGTTAYTADHGTRVVLTCLSGSTK